MGKTENDLGAGDDTVGTPQYILDVVYQLGAVDLDPCSHPKSIVISRDAVLLPLYRLTQPNARPRHATNIIYSDGLAISWAPYWLVYSNPPYSELDLWLAKFAQREAFELVSLVPIRSGNVGWAPATTADIRCDLPRVTHRDCKVHAPFHQCLLYFADPTVTVERLIEVANFFSVLGHVTINPKHLEWKQR